MSVRHGLLSGMRVIEGSAFIAAPSAGMTLAQMGADVIRYDPIGGGLDYRRWPLSKAGASLYWAQLNKGKRSIAVDLRREEGRAIARALVTGPGENAGLFLTSFPPSGWMAYDRLKATRQDLVMINITGNPDGSSAVDYTVNCATGFPFITGHDSDDRPVNNVVPAWDLVCGQQAVVALLAAERHRRLTGEGQFVRIALSDVGFATLANMGITGDIEINGNERPRNGNDIYGTYGRDFRTKDHRRLMICALTDRQWQSLVKATGIENVAKKIEQEKNLDLNDEGARFIARREISEALEPWCARHTLEDIGKIFDAAGVLWGPYRTTREALEQDWRMSEKNEIFEKVEQPDIGTILTPSLPMRFSAGNLSACRAPRLGEHTDQVLSEVLGMSEGEIGKLHDRGIVAGVEKAGT